MLRSICYVAISSYCLAKTTKKSYLLKNNARISTNKEVLLVSV